MFFMRLESMNSASSIKRSHDLRQLRAGRYRAPRRFWVKPGRSRTWWDNFVANIVPMEEWREKFLMSRRSFYSLCEKLSPYIEGETTRMRDPIEVDKQVALTLYYLSDEGRMRKTANAFGLSRASVSVVVRKVCKAISEQLGQQLIKLPKTEAEVTEKVNLFSTRYDFPICLGAVDGTHVEIKQLSGNATDYINRKSRFTINVQACCDCDCLFMDVVVKWPGSVHDVRVFTNSSLTAVLMNLAKRIVHEAPFAHAQ